MDTVMQILESITGLSGEATVLLVGVVVAVANLVGKLIPDTAPGALGLIRKIAKFVGLYVTNNSGYNRL